MVSKNLAALRKRANLTQEQMAEKLHVTRQAVSNWETGKCQPDVETLTALSEALGCDVTELIYGAKPVPYRRYGKKYIVWTAVLGVLVLAFLGCEIWLLPYLNELASTTFDIMPRGRYVLLDRPVGAAALGALLVAALSLWADLRLPKKGRVILIVAGVLCFLPLAVTVFYFFLGDMPPWLLPLFRAIRPLFTARGLSWCSLILPFFGAAALFFGFEK